MDKGSEMANMTAIAREIEHSPTVGDLHIHDLSHVYRELADLQTKDGGAQSLAFKQDLASLNGQLVHDGLLPSLQITGVDNANHILTKNAQTGDTFTQNADAVKDFGSRPDAASLAPLIMFSDAFKLPITPGSDSLVKVVSPADHANASTLGVLSKVFRGMVNGGDSNSADTTPAPPGMNPWMAQAWSGWPDTPGEV
jgi:hypothetical protein